jgi:iron complex outermembrane receptor protein
LNTKHLYLGGLAVVSSFVFAGAAYAQRANENVVAAAEDAFGTRVGNESVGLYDARNARGFDPQLAGNMRIEGLYFDQQGMFGQRISRAQTMRIGLSAQSYPFPAPSGITDISLLTPELETTVTVTTQYQTIGPKSVAIDVSTPLIGEKLGLAGGVNAFKQTSEWQGSGSTKVAAALLNAKPAEDVELIPFFFFNQFSDSEVQPLILPGGAFLPPRVDRSVFYGQRWAASRNSNFNGGFVGRAAVGGNWRLQTGVFRSIMDRPRNFTIFYRNTQADGSASLDIIGYPAHKATSTSGEVRGSGIFTQGSFRHTVHMAVRARDTERTFGGGQTINFGPATIGVYQPVAEPTYTFGIRDQDKVRQISPGVTYVGQWGGVGEFSVGVQKAYYSRNFGKLGAMPATTRSAPLLYNGTASAIVSPGLTVYAGYTRGLEEFGTAPDNAANAGEPLPAKETKQIDAGVRYRISPGLNLMAGVFQVEKPYFDRDIANIYTDVGNLRHRGVEMSLSGQPVTGLTVVAGLLLLEAKASGLPVDQGLIGDTSPGTPPMTIKTNLQYELPFAPGLLLDTQFDVLRGYYANRANTFKTPTQSVLSLGIRYNFKPFGQSTSLRFQVQNVLDEYAWTAEGASGRLAPIPPRRYGVRLATDF